MTMALKYLNSKHPILHLY